MAEAITAATSTLMLCTMPTAVNHLVQRKNDVHDADLHNRFLEQGGTSFDGIDPGADLLGLMRFDL